jgi:hypothetical protein
MRNILIAVVALSLLGGCCSVTFTAERVKEINDGWFKLYNQDRNPTKAEADEYAKLSDEEKIKWREAGKPVSRNLPAALLDAAQDLHKSIGSEIEAKKENE